MNSLHKDAEQYLAVRRALGLKLYWPGLALRDFASFLQQEGASHITTELALRWARQCREAQPSHWENQLSIARGFAKYMSARDPRTEVPPAGLLSHGPRRRTPYIYTDDEIRRLVKAARALPPARGYRGCRGWTCSTLIGLLAATGLRLGEACALDQSEVNLKEGLLTIRQTKFGKSRLVPIHTTICTALRTYARQRDKHHPTLRTPAFFMSDRGTRVKELAVWSTFVRLSDQVGLRTHAGRRRPRLHDLRHTFAVKTLVRWYREGRDVTQRLPILSTYLGHARVSHTYWYLSAVPELLGLALTRLEHRLKGAQS